MPGLGSGRSAGGPSGGPPAAVDATPEGTAKAATDDDGAAPTTCFSHSLPRSHGSQQSSTLAKVSQVAHRNWTLRRLIVAVLAATLEGQFTQPQLLHLQLQTLA